MVQDYLKNFNIGAEASERILNELKGFWKATNFKHDFKIDFSEMDLSELQEKKLNEICTTGFYYYLKQFERHHVEFTLTVLQLLMQVYAAESDK